MNKEQKDTSTNDLTQAILIYLNYNGFKAWRNNNVGIYDPAKGVFRRNPGTLKGVPDIIGFHLSDAKFIGVEVKNGKDRLSREQKVFLDELHLASGFSFVAYSFDEFVEKFERKFISKLATNKQR